MLNEKQRTAVEHWKGPCLTIAPPGSGKTKCLVERVVHLIGVHHVKPGNILVLTFTNEAAREMKDRFIGEFSSYENLPFFGTFHSLFFQILKEEYSYHQSNILKQQQSISCLKEALNQHGISYASINLLDLVKEFSCCINKNIMPKEFESNVLQHGFFQVFQTYREKKKKHHLIDFDDMMILVLELFQSRPEILQKWQKRYDYILLDEMQDINELQFQIVQLLLKEEQNIFAVGDDDQSIYGFRGSNPKIMLSFQKHFPNTKMIVLDTNYRSLRQIIEVSTHFICHNKNRYEKDCKGFLDGFGNVKYLKFQEEGDQVQYIINYIKTKNPSSLGILYRSKSDALLLAQMLECQKIPYFSKESFSDKILNIVLSDLITCLKLGYDLEVKHTLESDFCKGVLAFDSLRHLSLFAGINYIRKGLGYDRYLYHRFEKDASFYEYALRVCDLLQNETMNLPPTLSVFEKIEVLEGYKTKEAYRQNNKEDAKVFLYTYHGSKGLEFDEVFLITVNEGMVPSKFCESDMEEERRMFYVALTRAKFSLRICCIKNRGGKEYQPSRFINEMKN